MYLHRGDIKYVGKLRHNVTVTKRCSKLNASLVSTSPSTRTSIAKALMHLSMLSPKGRGGEGPRAYVGHLTSISFPTFSEI